MKILQTTPSLVEQVHKAILSEIAGGSLKSGERIIQEQLAQQLGVSRQPIQQALVLLRKQGVLKDAPGRGLLVAPLDLDHVRQMYDIRAVIEGLAFRRAAENNSGRAAAEGPALIRAGRNAVASKSFADMIAADKAFHDFIYELSENPLLGPAMEAQWTNTQRVMGEVLMHGDKPRDIWDQHEALLATVIAGDGVKAEQQAREHILEAADFMIHQLQADEAKD